ncbi:hypothetical protein TCAL_00217 [Tigriopus californicus]|uniref:Glutamate receptor ionotropic, kainate 2 n=1 Tax=Tigriopus californicus TaxID=6832 RepID=A0A553P3I1_TIGCA|nr:hypothetical protein TCAL_00217 [Tigriopus californicus]
MCGFKGCSGAVRCQIMAFNLPLWILVLLTIPRSMVTNAIKATTPGRKTNGCALLPNQHSQSGFNRYQQRKMELRVGVIYTQEEFAQGFRKQAFVAASRLLNQNSDDFCLQLDDILVQNLSSFHLSKSVCSSLETNGYHALIGPNSEELSPHAKSICNAIDIPYLEMVPDSSSRLMIRDSGQFSLNAHPKLEDIHAALRDFLVFANWTRVALVYTEETAKRSLLLQDLLLSQGFQCLSLRISLNMDRNVIQLLKQKDFHNVLIDIPDPDIYLPKFFQVCHDIGWYGEGRNFFLSTLEFNELTTPNPPKVFNKHYNKVYPHWKSFSFFRIHNRDLPGSMDFADAMSAMHLLQRQRLLRSRNHDERGHKTHNREQSDEEAFPFITKVKQDKRVPYWTNGEGSKFGTFSGNNNNNNNSINNNDNKSSAGASSSITNQSTESSSPSTIIFEAVDIGNHVAYEAAIIYDSLLILLNTVQALNYQYAPLLLLLTPEHQSVPSHHNHNEDPLGRKVGANAHYRQGPDAYDGDDDGEGAATRHPESEPQRNRPPGNDKVSCKSEKPWLYGPTFYNYLNAVQVEGMTGKLSFKGGRRSSLNLELMRYSRHNEVISKIGHWSTTTGLSVLNRSLIQTNESDEVILTVVTREERPYVMINKSLKGNDAFDGFAIDLLKAISDVVGFKFRLYTVPDNLYGVYNHETAEWNGIVRQLTDKRADLAVASMTINYARETVIDFTKPFMNLGISILFKAPKDPATELFSFMNPLALEIWLYMLLAYILVSITIWIVARFSPYEWAHPHPCIDTGLVFQNDFTLPNSFWFAIGTLMQQGSDLNPKAASTRIVGGIWWFFTLIIISSYTANLAAFLTVERMATPIESAEDLADQSDIKYGTLVGGSTMTFFRDSKIETYQKMWRYMESNDPDTFTHSYEEGVERVLRGNYAFLCESTMLDYLLQRNCNLTQIGGLLDNKGYGIATPIGSKWKDKISQAVLFLQEKGVIQMYYDKWWKNHGPQAGRECKKKKLNDQAQANALGVVNIGGIFVVLLCGLAFAVIVAIIEFCWRTKHHQGVGTTSFGGGARRGRRTSGSGFGGDVPSTRVTGVSGHGQSLFMEMLHNLAPFLFGTNDSKDHPPNEADELGHEFGPSGGGHLTVNHQDRPHSQNNRDLQYIEQSRLTTCSLIREQNNL